MLPTGLSPMLASTGPLPEGGDWAYEVKWDGVRALVAVEGGRVRATSRNGNDLTGAYPELRTLPTCLGATAPAALFDGELVALVDGLPDFGALQQRMHTRSPRAELVHAVPVTFVPFDVLHVGGASLLATSYDARRAVLDSLGLEVPAPFHGDARVLLDLTFAQGLEGLVAKRRDSPYLPGRRSDCWVKAKHTRRQSAVVCGWKGGDEGSAPTLGSLLLGVHGPDGLVYAGHVGTGFSVASRRQVAADLAPLSRPSSPYDGPVPREHARVAHWVEPVLVADVQFAAWTRDGRLRHPSYKGMRDDLDPAQVTREP